MTGSKILPAISLLLCFGSVTDAKADSFTIDLSSPLYFDKSGSNGFWDFYDGQIRAPFAKGGSAGKELDFGDASDGAFNDGPSQTGISISGSLITFDSSIKAVFQFSSFNLSNGKTITITGSSPVTIRVAGTTSIAGTIAADGATGGGNASPPAAGGAGFAGGSPGGLGGKPTPSAVSASSGLPASGIPLGGGIGTNQTTTGTEQGGGGACSGTGTNNATSGTGAANAASCATSYSVSAAAFETTFTGGGGGGGGGAYSNGANLFGGGGGGGGGGAIHLVSFGAITLAAPGSISAKGGVGGNYNTGNAVDCGGGGGGGSGGSVWIQTAGALSGTGVVNIAGGTGGTSTSCPGFYDGGAGSRGIFRADTQSGTLTPTTNPAASSDAFSVSTPTGQTYTVVSKPLDMSGGYYALATPIETLGCGNAPAAGTLSVVYEGSTDGKNFEHPVAKDRIGELNAYSFIRFKVSIFSTTSNPPCLTGLAIPYGLKEVSDIQLKGGLFCGSLNSSGSNQSGPKPSPLAIVGDLLMITLAVLISYRLPSAKRSSPSY